MFTTAKHWKESSTSMGYNNTMSYIINNNNAMTHLQPSNDALITAGYSIVQWLRKNLGSWLQYSNNKINNIMWNDLLLSSCTNKNIASSTVLLLITLTNLCPINIGLVDRNQFRNNFKELFQKSAVWKLIYNVSLISNCNLNDNTLFFLSR